jgi:hypothetical protein
MREFVKRGPMPIDRLKVSRRRRDLHEIAARIIVGARAADAEVGTGRGNQGFSLRFDLVRWGRDYRASDVLGQIALVGVEESETLEERDRARLFPGLRGMLALTLGNEAIGIDDGGAPLSLPDMAAEPERLTKRQPALAGEAVFNNGTPQNQHVNSRVAALRRSIARHGERRLDRRRPPWLHPWDAAGLQFGDDLVGDFGVKAGPILTGARL